jgi:serine/threonine protein kinase
MTRPGSEDDPPSTLGRTEPDGEPTLPDEPPPSGAEDEFDAFGKTHIKVVQAETSSFGFGSDTETVAITPEAPTEADPKSPPVPGATAERKALRRGFGDYELGRELGKGGMGIVYEARQLSLNRTVALKMMRSGSFAREDELRRFQNEAEAVAQLDHPHIVPILDVGQYADRYYFTMRLVHGGSLAEQLDRYKGDWKAAARLLVSVADAVHHAHQRGILHRDLKPANILVDGQGEPHVTDFGLARRVEANDQLTESGTIMGTPGYMAPEQAAGRRGAITVAADVYGLGAVLYALLTGRAPFVGETAVDTLRQVSEREPDAPSRLDDRVPRDLETICLKCLEKDPKRRYPNASAVADDLRHWLAGEPITARPVGAGTRLLMWCRRNPTLAAAVACVLLTGVVGFAGIVWQWRRAEANLKKSQDRFDLAMEAVKGYTAGTSEDVLLKQPQLEGLRTRLLTGSLSFYRKLEASLAGETDSRAREALGRAYAEAGDLNAKIGSKEEALRAHQQALTIREELQRRRPGDLDLRIDLRIDLARSQFEVGHMQYETGRDAEAMPAFRKALALRQELSREHPERADVQFDVAQSYNSIAAELLRTGNNAEALESLLASLAIRENLRRDDPRNTHYGDELGKGYGNVGVVLGNMGRHTEALEKYTKALNVFEELARDNPTEAAQFRSDQAGALRNIAYSWLRQGRSDAAAQTFDRALAVADSLVHDRPTDTGALAMLAQIDVDVGDQRAANGRVADAASVFRKATEILGTLARGNPSVSQYRSDLARSLLKLGQTSARLGRGTEALDALKQARATSETLVQRNSTSAAYRADLSLIEQAYGDLLVQLSRGEEALTHFRDAAKIAEQLRRDRPGEAQYRRQLTTTYRATGNLLRNLRRTDDALVALRKAVESAESLVKDDPGAVQPRYSLAMCYNAVGEALRPADRYMEALDVYQKAEAVLEPLARENPSQHQIQYEWAAVLANLGLVRAHTVSPEAGADEMGKAVAVLEPLAREHPMIRNYQVDLAAMNRERGAFQRQAGHREQAADSFRRAVAVEEKLTNLRAGELRTLAGYHALLSTVIDDPDREAEQAMSVLTRAVAAGERNASALQADPDLEALRPRDDFKRLLSDLTAKPAKPDAK